MRACRPDDQGDAEAELIGQGALAKMVRIALSDPDDALWAYSIAVGGRGFAGREILGLEPLVAALNAQKRVK